MRSLLLLLAALGLAAAPALAQSGPGEERAGGAAAPEKAAPPPSAEEVKRLVEQLGSLSFVEREAATEHLRQIGKPAFPLLEAALESDDAEVRYRARLLLRARIRQVQSLLQHISNPTSPADAEGWSRLTTMGDEAVEPLVQILRRDLATPSGGDENVVRVALSALEKIVEDSGSAVSVEGLLSLFDLGLRGSEADFAKALKGWSPEKAHERVGRLAVEGKTAVVRQNAVAVLGLFADDEAIPLLLPPLRDAEADVRSAAIRGVVGIARAKGSPPPADALSPTATAAIVRALDDPVPAVELCAMEGLASLRSKAALAHFRAILSDAGGRVPIGDPRIMASVRGIGLLGDKDAVPSLLPLLSSDQPELQGAAALALGRLGAKEAVEPLVKMLEKDDGSSVPFNYIVAALGRIGDPSAYEPLHAFYLARPNYRRNTLGAIAALDCPGAMKFLIDKAKTSDDEVEVKLALVTLVHHATPVHGNTELGEVALATLSRQDWQVRKMSLELIEHVRYKPAAEAVAKQCTAGEERVVQQAVEALGEIGDKSHLELLRGLLKQKNSSIAQSVMVALARLGEPEPFQAALADAKNAVEKKPDYNSRFLLGLLDLYQKDDKAGAEQFQKIVDEAVDGADVAVALYNLACAKSILGEKDAAIDALKKTVDRTRSQGSGWDDMSWHMDLDDDLDNIRSSVEVKKLLDELYRASPDAALMNEGIDDEAALLDEMDGGALGNGQQIFFGNGGGAQVIVRNGNAINVRGQIPIQVQARLRMLRAAQARQQRMLRR